MQRRVDQITGFHKSQSYRMIEYRNTQSLSAFLNNNISSSNSTFFSVIPKTLFREFQSLSFF